MDTRAFLVGFATAGLLGAGAYHYYLKPAEPDPCRACSTGTRCAAGLCVVANAPAQPVVRKRPGQRPRIASAGNPNPSSAGTGTPGQPTVEPETQAAPEPPPPPPPPPLTAQEKRLVTVGDKLTGTEVINMAEAGGSERELSQEDLDAVVRPKQGAIVSCIDDARGDAQLEAIITVAFRVRRSGDVAGVRIEAPSYLINHGLSDCIRRIITPLRFPQNNKAQIATYPFSLR